MPYQRMKHLWPNLIWQPLIAVVFMCLILFVMNEIATSNLLWAVGAGSLASSCYLVFGNPTSESARPSKLLGGYLIGMTMGLIIRFVSELFYKIPDTFISSTHFHAMGMLAAVAVGLSLFFMIIFKSEHPPAAGLSLVLVIDVRDYFILTVVLLGALLLAMIRYGLRNQLQDLF